MADEYIRRDDFIQYLEKCKKGAAVTNLVWAAIMAIERDVRDMPAADVAPVRHGRWLTHYRSGVTVADGFVSSCCDMWSERRSNYCPYCGATMDGGNGNG